MVVPLAGRVIAAVIGVLLVFTAARSVIGTVIVPRPVGSWLTRWVDKVVALRYRVATDRITDHKRRDRVLAGQAAAILLLQLVAWLAIFYIGFSLLQWPFVSGGITLRVHHRPARRCSGPNERPGAAAERTIADLAAMAALITVTLQIAYLPTLYSAFNRRETEVALLNARAGVPSWGPELLARTYYALGSGVSTIDTLPDLYEQWERWAADVAESHTTYLPLVRFRSPKPMSSWVTALLAVLDSAALILALSPKVAPVVPARLCLRSGFLCFNDVARAMGLEVPAEPDPSAGISLSYEEFLDAVARMDKVDFPIERKPEDAWPDFVGWRVNYEQAAYAMAYALDAVPALWSGPRRHPAPADPPDPAARGQAAQVARRDEACGAARPGRDPGRAGPGRPVRRRVDRERRLDPAALRLRLLSRPGPGPEGRPSRPPGTRPVTPWPRWRWGRASARPASATPAARRAGSTASGEPPTWRSSSTRPARSRSGCGTGPCSSATTSCAPGCRPGRATAGTRGGSAAPWASASATTNAGRGGTASSC